MLFASKLTSDAALNQNHPRSEGVAGTAMRIGREML